MGAIGHMFKEVEEGIKAPFRAVGHGLEGLGKMVGGVLTMNPSEIHGGLLELDSSLSEGVAAIDDTVCAAASLGADITPLGAAFNTLCGDSMGKLLAQAAMLAVPGAGEVMMAGRMAKAAVACRGIRGASVAEKEAARERAMACAKEMIEAFRDSALDQAREKLDALASAAGAPVDGSHVLLFRVAIAIQQGQSRDALNHMTQLGCDTHQELHALCLYSMQDPCWEGLAHKVAETSRPAARLAMTRMLERHAAIIGYG